MKYVKPNVYVERFRANAYCLNCDATKYNKPVTVTCILTQSEVVYSSDTNWTEGSPSTCNYYASGLVKFDGGYFENEVKAIEAFADRNVTDSEYSKTETDRRKYYVSSGSYLVWSGGGMTHMGSVTESFYEELTENS